jgi:hypothetical protein
MRIVLWHRVVRAVSGVILRWKATFVGRERLRISIWGGMLLAELSIIVTGRWGSREILGERGEGFPFLFSDRLSISCNANAYRFPGTKTKISDESLSLRNSCTFSHQVCKNLYFVSYLGNVTIIWTTFVLSKMQKLQDLTYKSLARRSRNEAANVAVAWV